MHRLAIPLLLAACTNGVDVDTTGALNDGLPVLGNGSHDLASVQVREVVTEGLDWPRDLEFHPTEDQLWIVNRRPDCATIVRDPQGVAEVEMAIGSDPSNNHFMAKPSALAFGNNGAFATAHEEHQETQGSATPPDFMGPTLWTSEAEGFDSAHGSHLDMLHNSPDGAGIAWERRNVYWVFDGWHNSLTRYDFNEDHGLGGSDHTDGIVRRFADGEMGYQRRTVSHLAYDRDTDLLYVADSGNNRIAVLDTTTGTVGNPIAPNYDGTDQRMVDGAEVLDLVLGEDVSGMSLPSGLELADGLLWVTDADTSTIFAFDLDGTLVDYLETGWEADTLGGMAIDDEGDLWLVDQVNDKVVEISPL